MRISDWISDVCSSDLCSRASVPAPRKLDRVRAPPSISTISSPWAARAARIDRGCCDAASGSAPGRPGPTTKDGKSVGEGKGVSVRVGHGGGRIINNIQNMSYQHLLDTDTQSVN